MFSKYEYDKEVAMQFQDNEIRIEVGGVSRVVDVDTADKMITDLAYMVALARSIRA